MQKLIKSRILYFIIGVTIAIGITSVFAYDLFANNVGYNPTDSEWKKQDGTDIVNTQEALDDLHTRLDSVAFKKICRYVNNEYSHDQSDKLSVGTMYECNPGDGIKRNFYILEVYENSIDLIMDRNLASTNLTWQGAKRYFRLGDGKDLNWSNVQLVKLPEAQQIANAVNNPSWKYEDSNSNGAWFCFGLNDQSSCAQGGWTYRTEAGKEQAKPHRWLYNYISGCSSFGCDHDIPSGEIFQNGYWTDDSIVGYNQYWCIDKYAMINNCDSSSIRAVRPVITIYKSNLFG